MPKRLRLLILSRRAGYYSTARLVETIRKLGHSAIVVNPLKCVLSADAIWLGREKIPPVDVVIPKLGNIAIEYSLSLVKHFELAGVPVINSSESIYLAKDKFNSLQVLKHYGLPVPATEMLRSPSLLKPVVKRLGGLPVVLKLLRGSQGIGVTLARTMKELKKLVKDTWRLDHDIIIQQYFPETRGEDVRILVVGGKVIAGMRRFSSKGDFRSNIHQGGQAGEIKLTSKYRKLARRAAGAIGLQVAGVDIIETRNGPLVIEVNGSPGFEGLEKTTGLDIARAIIDFSCDIQRLTPTISIEKRI